MVFQGFREPAERLSPFVERFWWTEIDAGTPLLPMDAGTGAELIFHLSLPLFYNGDGHADRFPPVSLIRVTKERIELSVPGAVTFLSVRFRTGMVRHFLPKGALNDLPSIIDGEQLWGDSMKRLYDEILGDPHIDRAIQRIEQFLLSMLSLYHWRDGVVDHLAALLYYGPNDLTVQNIADRIGYSRRQLQRICTNSFGISPKMYRSTVRFNRVKKYMLMSEKGHYLSHALDSGYYDQAHFIHEFERFTTMTPGDYYRDYSHVLHFYKESLPISKQMAMSSIIVK